MSEAAYKKEINRLRAHIKDLEICLEDSRRHLSAESQALSRSLGEVDGYITEIKSINKQLNEEREKNWTLRQVGAPECAPVSVQASPLFECTDENTDEVADAGDVEKVMDRPDQVVKELRPVHNRWDEAEGKAEHMKQQNYIPSQASTKEKNTHNFSCPDCVKVFAFAEYLAAHKKREHTVRRHRCPTCDKCYSNASHLQRHIHTAHNDAKKFVCPTCQKAFIHLGDLKLHIRSIHEGVRFTCATCAYKCTSKWNLRIHERMHSGIKPYVCEICGKSFIQNSCLTVHRRYHLQQKPFPCEFCDKSFVTSRDKKRHEKRIHVNVN